jgi:prephenate dehydratase
MSRRYGFLGPTGTFTEMALRQCSQVPDEAERVPFISVDAAMAALRAGDLEAAMVPIENSVEGGVSSTLDALASGAPLVVVAEQVVPITFVLAVPAGMSLADIRTVSTHPHAWAQVRAWMGANLPEAEYLPAPSTAAAAAGLAGGPAGERPAYQGAVCAPVAAANHGLTVLRENIGDRTGAVTRFVLVSRPGPLPAVTGADKTSVVLFQREDHPGGLLGLLEQFATRGINLTRIESRPNGGRLGDYCFSIDCEGHVSDERVGETLMGLRRVCADVRFLGSYPRADNIATQVSPGTTDQDFIGARDWLRSLRDPPA